MNIFLGILLVIIGGLLVYYSRNIEQRFGRWMWAEQYLGGTAQGCVLIGFVIIVLGLLATFGVVDLAK